MARGWKLSWARPTRAIERWSVGCVVVVGGARSCESEVLRPASRVSGACWEWRADLPSGMKASGLAELVNKLCRWCLSSLSVVNDVELR